ncbi:Sialyltransferase-like protein 1 [Dissostichus eleginoides]|uniref:Sialyltransferase-like protein 1 n=1 Tax=Dissostichus eleginoides TaxID=100907 RepID=A0AAD9CEU7_DISEL|nr:Sialyltransferase-like protein 1 [Dissostichus eleginoides]
MDGQVAQMSPLDKCFRNSQITLAYHVIIPATPSFYGYALLCTAVRKSSGALPITLKLTVGARSDWDLDVRGAAACDRVSSVTSSRVVKHCEETGVSRVADARRDGTLFEGA